MPSRLLNLLNNKYSVHDIEILQTFELLITSVIVTRIYFYFCCVFISQYFLSEYVSQR